MTIREKIRKIAVWGCCFILFSCTETKEVIEYVNPFIGTEQVYIPTRGLRSLSVWSS